MLYFLIIMIFSGSQTVGVYVEPAREPRLNTLQQCKADGELAKSVAKSKDPKSNLQYFCKGVTVQRIAQGLGKPV